MMHLATIDVVAVDSDQNGRQTLFSALRSAGVRRVRLATSAEHATALVSHQKPTLLITAQSLADGSGMALAATLKAQAAMLAASRKEKYGLDLNGASAFVGDLDELLSDAPKTMADIVAARPIPVLLVTARPTHDLVAQAREAGIVGILVKPFTQADFSLRLKAVLRIQ